MPSDVRSCGFASVRVLRVRLQQAVIERRKIGQQHVGLREIAQRLECERPSQAGLMLTAPSMPGEPGDAICRPYSSSFGPIHFEQFDVDDHFRARLVDGRDQTRAAAATRSGVSLIVSALVAVIAETRRASSTSRSISIVSLTSALLR